MKYDPKTNTTETELDDLTKEQQQALLDLLRENKVLRQGKGDDTSKVDERISAVNQKLANGVIKAN